MLKQNISSLFRKLGLARLADYLHFIVKKWENLIVNNAFKKQNTSVILPPDYMLYESFQMNYEKYYTGGKEDALEIIETVKPLCNLQTGKILDWGCGPARIIRHFPEIIGSGNEYYGTDYNPKTITWCKQNFPGIAFSRNQLLPPLSYPHDFFDFIYGISILTHLSGANQQLWCDELFRVLSQKGIVMLTTHGDAFIDLLTQPEINSFKSEVLITRSKVKEGHRMYGAFHPPSFIRKVFANSGFSIVRHIPGMRVTSSYISQDVWLLKK